MTSRIILYDFENVLSFLLQCEKFENYIKHTK